MGHGSGCFPSSHKHRDMCDHRTSQGRVIDGYVVPAYATYDDALPQVRLPACRRLTHPSCLRTKSPRLRTMTEASVRMSAGAAQQHLELGRRHSRAL